MEIYKENIGNSIIPWYGLMVVTGTVIALIFIYWRWRQKGYSKFHFGILSTFGLIISLFGARWWYLAFHPEHYTGMIDLFQISEGRAIQGAIFFGGTFIWMYTKWIAPDLEFRKVASIIAPHVLLAQAIGRWGNFYNHEIYGIALSGDNPLWYLPEFIREGMKIDGVYYNPLFLWESIANFVGWVLLGFFLYDSKWLKDGALIGLYMIWYNTTRAIMEPMRDPEFIMNINGVPTSFIIAVISAFLGVWTFIFYQFEIFNRVMAWHKYKQDEFTLLWKRRFKLIFAYMTLQIGRQEFTTMLGVSKNRYNKYINSLNKEEIERYKKNL